MFATAARCSKASRRPLTSKKGNKDYYKGTRQSYLPGGLRTGAPGKHVVQGKAKYRLIDEKARVFIAPPIEEIEKCRLKPYVHEGLDDEMTRAERRASGQPLSPSQLLTAMQKHGLSYPEVPRRFQLVPPKKANESIVSEDISEPVKPETIAA